MTKVSKPKIIAVVGPTATGKSGLAVLLARKYKGEIISADSRQIYKGMSIGTGKISTKEMRGVPHHLLDIASPKNVFNVTRFKKLAEKEISKIIKRGKTPFLVGGTGFWIDSVAFNQNFPEVQPNKALRKKLEQLGAEKVFAVLQKIDPKRAAGIDRYNKRRVIRAIEVAKYLKQSSTALADAEPIYQTLFIGLDMPNDQLDKKISARLDQRLKQGMIAEVKRLRSQGVSWKRLDDFGLEYRYASRHIQGELTKNEMREQLLVAIRQYAKRQRTWFKRNKNIVWLDPNKKSSPKAAYAAIDSFLS